MFILGLFTPTMAMFLDSSILLKLLGSAACFPGLISVCRAWYSANDQCKRVKPVALRMHRMRRIYAKEHGQTLLRPTGPLDASMKPLIDSLHIEELVNAEASSTMI